MANERGKDDIVFEIRAHLGVLSTKKDKDGWKRELNLVSWNGQDPPKFDIREWSDDHTRMSRGITLYEQEMRKIVQYFTQFSNARTISESRNNRNAAARAGLKAGEENREIESEEVGKKESAEQGRDAINDSAYAASSKVPQAGAEEDVSEKQDGSDSHGEKDNDAMEHDFAVPEKEAQAEEAAF